MALAEEPAARITVVAEPLSQTEARAPTSFATAIDTAERGAEGDTVTEALSEAAGVQVRRFGGLGAFSTLSVRGSAANQVQVYLDGIPLSRARNETVNLADLPLDSLERIEVYRGTVPVGFGTSGIGGVVNLVTRRPPPTPATEVATSLGSFWTRKVVASHSRRLRGIDLLGHVTYLGSQGDFSFFDDNGTKFQPADDEIATRQNNQFDALDALLRGGYSLAGGLRLEATSETFYRDEGVPGIGNTQSDTASFSELRSLNYVRLERSGWFAGRLDAVATLYGIYQREQFVDREEDLKTGPQDRDDVTAVAGGNVNGTLFPLPNHALGWFAGISHERFSGRNRIPENGDEPDQTRLRAALAIEDQVLLLGERLLLVPSLRYEHLRDRISERLPVGQTITAAQTASRDLLGPAVGVQVRLLPGVALKGNLGRFQRAPNFSELFGIRGAVAGDAALKSETAINRDLGFAVSWRRDPWVERAELTYAYFNNDIEDVIVLVPVNQAFFSPLNVGGARVRGHEVTLGLRLLRHFGLELNYTHQDAENRGADPNTRGNQLPGRPQDELYARTEAFGRRWKIHYEFDFVSGNFLTQSNFEKVPRRDIHTVGLRVLPRDWIELDLEVRNITDNRASDVAGFPLPGRSLFGTVKVRL